MLRGKPQQLADWTGQAAGRSVGNYLPKWSCGCARKARSDKWTSRARATRRTAVGSAFGADRTDSAGEMGVPKKRAAATLAPDHRAAGAQMMAGAQARTGRRGKQW